MPISVAMPPLQRGSKERRVVNPMPEAQKKAALADTAYVCTITDVRWPGRSRSYGVITIQPCEKGERFHVTLVQGQVELADIGDGRCVEITTTAAQVANDIEQDINSGGVGTIEGVCYYGIFAMDHPLPTEEELRDAEAKMNSYYEYLVREARTLFQRPNMVNEITDVMRRAGNKLGIDEPWIRVVVQMQDCPGCGERLRPNVAVCKSCGAILDRARAIELGIIKEEKESEIAPELEAEPAKKRTSKKVA